MTITVYLDSNVWNFLRERPHIDLIAEFPSPDFRLCITRAVEMEIAPIKNTILRAFIATTIQRCAFETESLFGFDGGAYGGFDEGRLGSSEETAFIAPREDLVDRTKVRPSGLFRGQGDIHAAAMASHSVVLTLDVKRGGLRDASTMGWKVVRLTDFDECGLSLRDFVAAELAKIGSQD